MGMSSDISWAGEALWGSPTKKESLLLASVAGTGEHSKMYLYMYIKYRYTPMHRNIYIYIYKYIYIYIYACNI